MMHLLDVTMFVLLAVVLAFCGYNLVFLGLSLRVLNQEYREHKGYFDAWKAAIVRGDWAAVNWYEANSPGKKGFPKLAAFERRWLPWYAKAHR